MGSTSSDEISNVDGSSVTETLERAVTAVVSNSNDDPIGVLTVTGTLFEDQELLVDTNSIADADGLADFLISKIETFCDRRCDGRNLHPGGVGG